MDAIDWLLNDWWRLAGVCLAVGFPMGALGAWLVDHEPHDSKKDLRGEMLENCGTVLASIALIPIAGMLLVVGLIAIPNWWAWSFDSLLGAADDPVGTLIWLGVNGALLGTAWWTIGWDTRRRREARHAGASDDWRHNLNSHSFREAAPYDRTRLGLHAVATQDVPIAAVAIDER